MVVSKYEPMADEQLTGLAAGGDSEAFDTLRPRYFADLFEFGSRIVRHPDIVLGTFTKAWTKLAKGKKTRNLKAWLSTIAGNKAIRKLRRRKRLTPRGPDDESERGSPLPAYRSRFSNPAAAGHDQELADLAWDSAVRLSPKDYTLLDMHVRRGLSADEMAEPLGIGKGALYTTLSRLRDSLQDAVACTLLIRPGRGDCSGLDDVVSDTYEGELTKNVRKAVHGHVEVCSACRALSQSYASACEVFGGLAPVAAAPGLQAATWGAILRTIALR